jgi:hypothetical protein
MPLLYAQLEVGARGAATFHFGAGQIAGFFGFDADGGCSGWEEEVPGRAAVVRRLAALAAVRVLRIRALPPDHITQAFAGAAAALAEEGITLFPSLQSVILLPHAVDGLRTWTPASYDGPQLPPFLDAVAHARPSQLCVAFRLVPARDWEAHREASYGGQYVLIRRIQVLAGGWTLKSVHYHDLVFQVPPSIPGTANVYEFAPHPVPHPLFPSRFRFPEGGAAVGLPGPEWNIRPWQMSATIKELFPSGQDHMATLEGTRWAFSGVRNHLLAKAARDDDDSTGVWYGEIEDMVKDSLRGGLDRDLPARGMGRDVIDQMWEHISYAKAERCSTCGRECRLGFGGADSRRPR